MNTTQIGLDFEKKVFRYFSSLLRDNDCPGSSKKASKIFLHKKYKCSNDRVLDFDITIENYNTFKTGGEWSSIIVIECKKYKNKVNISDLDEFSYKLHLLSISGVKGIMVTPLGFSKTEIKQARRDHISLVVFSNEQDCKWLVARNPNRNPEDLMPILLGRKSPGLSPIVYEEPLFTDALDLLKGYGAAVDESILFSIPYYNNRQLENKAAELIKTAQINIGSKDIAGDIWAKCYSNVSICFSDLQSSLLGILDLKENILTISNEVKLDVHRRNFTLAHEIGHLFLHADILRTHLQVLKEYGDISILPDEIIRRMEIQADLFASYLLMPKKNFYYIVNCLFKERSITTGKLYLDYQPCNKYDVDYVLCQLSRKFNVSKEAAKNRLINADLLKVGDSLPKRIRDFYR